MQIRIFDGRTFFYQWDLNQKVIVAGFPECKEVHFANRMDGESYVVRDLTNVDGLVIANVPNILLQSAKPILVYVYTDDNTEHCEKINVWQRPKPSNYIYTPTQVTTWEQMESKIKEIEEKITKIEELEIEGEISFEDINKIVEG